MNISRSKVKFMQDGKLYTFLQKDEDSGLRFYHDGEYINLVTKNEVLENMPDVTYLNNHRIFYYLHGQCIQLAVYEDIIGGSHTITFNNQDILENNNNVTTYNEFTTALKLDVEKSMTTIGFTNNNSDLTCNEYAETTEVGSVIEIVTTEYAIVDIDTTDDSIVSCVDVKTGALLSTSVTYTIETLSYEVDNKDDYIFIDTESRGYCGVLISSGETTVINERGGDL